MPSVVLGVVSRREPHALFSAESIASSSQSCRNTCEYFPRTFRSTKSSTRLDVDSLVAAVDSLDLHDQSMLAWAQVVQMTTMLRLFEEDVSTAVVASNSPLICLRIPPLPPSSALLWSG